MARIFTASLSFAAVLLLSTTVSAQCADGSCQGGAVVATCSDQGNCCAWNRPYTEESQPDVFHDFYQPGNCGGVPARAFPAPFPTPALAGRSYTTYQPFMPNEWLYKHHRTYHQPYNMGFGLNRTFVSWHGTPVRTELMQLRKFFSIAR